MAIREWKTIARLSAMIAGIGSVATAPAACPAPTEQTIPIHAAIVVPRDLALGTVLYSSTRTVTWPTSAGCGESDARGDWNYAQAPFPSYSQDIYRSGLEAVGVRILVDGRVLPTDAQMLAQSAQSNASVIVAPRNARDSVARSGSVTIELVKIAQASASGAIRGNDLPVGQYRTELLEVLGRFGFSGEITVHAATCSTPSVSVQLGDISVNQIAHAGVGVGAKAFELRLNGCPIGLNKISYRLDALSGVIDPIASVIALSAAATGRGVGIQIRDGDGKPLELGVLHEFTAQDVALGGNFRIPLEAAYYRDRSQAPSPGSISASLTFTIAYE